MFFISKFNDKLRQFTRFYLTYIDYLSIIYIETDGTETTRKTKIHEKENT